MTVQDDAREKQTRYMFNLKVAENRARSDVDALLDLDGYRFDFELKSTTKKTVSTVRDFGPDHIAKWNKGLHWIFGFYGAGNYDEPEYFCYASPLDMRPWIAEKARYIRTDFELALRAAQLVDATMVQQILGVKSVYSSLDAKRLMKSQWDAQTYREAIDVEIDPAYSEFDSKGRPKTNPGGYSLSAMTEMLSERCAYVIRRGSTLNNPHIESGFFKTLTKIRPDAAAEELRVLVRAFIKDPAAAPYLETAKRL